MGGGGADGRKDGQADMTRRIVAFGILRNAPKNSNTFLWEILIEEFGICKYVNKSEDFWACE